MSKNEEKTIDDFLAGKSDVTRALFAHFTQQFLKIGAVTFHPAKTMIGVATPRKRIAYITHLGKDFIHVVFPFEQAYPENLCFQKIAEVPGKERQFNHHFRMYQIDDVNAEVKNFMRLAYKFGK